MLQYALVFVYGVKWFKVDNQSLMNLLISVKKPDDMTLESFEPSQITEQTDAKTLITKNL